MARRSVPDEGALDEKTPGEGISPATDGVDDAPSASDIAPSASEDAGCAAANEAEDLVKCNLEGVEELLHGDRNRQTLTGAMVVANAITFAGILIANAIRESSKAQS